MRVRVDLNVTLLTISFMFLFDPDESTTEDVADNSNIQLANLQKPDGDDASGGGFAPDWLGDALLACKSFAEAGGMEFVLAWVGLSVLVGFAARWMKHSAGAWFVISLIASPLVGGMFLLSRGRGRRTCPYCHDLNDVEVVYCYTCGWEMPPAEQHSDTK